MNPAAAVRSRRPREVQTEALNMTPMIDVVFQLLIFFMLTMQFREVEGKLLSHLPKTHGPHSAPNPTVLDEVRIVVCAGGDLDGHHRDKGFHEKSLKDGAVCRVQVERTDVGDVARTETRPSALAANRAVYRGAAERARGLLDAGGGTSRRVILDADSEVPYEHIVGLVDALKSARLDAVEFVANPRHAKYAR
jgi:biopolymer transport protein ExbD